MPFYIIMLAVLYYIPYILFRVANSDIISLKVRWMIILQFVNDPAQSTISLP